MLAEVVDAAKHVLRAERGSVWLYDAATDEMVMRVATGIAPVRVPAASGFVGACARERRIINVPDCYADERFNPESTAHPAIAPAACSRCPWSITATLSWAPCRS